MSARRQVFEQRFVERNRRVEFDKVEFRVRRFAPEPLAELGQRRFVIAANRVRVDDDSLAGLRVFEFDVAAKREFDLRFVENMKENDVVLYAVWSENVSVGLTSIRHR